VPGLRLLIAALLAGLLGPGCDAPEAGPRTLVLAHVLTPEHAVHRAMTRMSRDVAALTGGALSVQIRHSAQLGAEKELVEKLQSGQIQLAKISTNAIDALIPELGVLALPFLFRDRAHYEAVVDGEIGRELLASLEPAGLVGLVYYEAGARSFYARTPIEGIASLAGMRIRVQQSPTMIASMRALGAIPVPIPFGPELTLALQKGERVAAAENNPPSYWTQEHWRSCPHYFLDRHTRAPDILLANRAAWAALAAAERQAVLEAARRSAVWQRATWLREEETLLARLEDEGVQVTRDVDVAPFVAATRAVYDALPNELRALTERIRSAP
jgi:tripartite ATP-independent transporter DctP family solute receptor